MARVCKKIATHHGIGIVIRFWLVVVSPTSAQNDAILLLHQVFLNP